MYKFGVVAINDKDVGTLVRPFKLIFGNKCNGSEVLSLASEETITAAFNVDETPTTSVVIDKMFLNSKEVNCPIVKY